MFVLITLFAALSCAIANPTVVNQHPNTFNHHLNHHPNVNTFVPQPLAGSVAGPVAGPVATPFTTNTNANSATNTNRRGRWLAEPVATVGPYKPVWSPSWSPAWSPSWAPASAWGASGMYYSAPAVHKVVPWTEPAWKVDPVAWKSAPHYAAGWAHEPVPAKWVSGDKWVTDKWSSGWVAPSFYGAQVAPWAAPVMKKQWAEEKPYVHQSWGSWDEVKPAHLAHYSAGFEHKPWEVKPVVEGFDDPSKPFKYSATIVHEKPVSA